MGKEELRLVEVVTEEVGSPRNDGSAGSALYVVPIRLNRVPDALETTLLRRVWDNPPQFTAMHRHGILRVAGDRILLDGTTVEEVERYHAKTLGLVLNEVNQSSAEHQAREDAEAARKEEEESAHRNNVRDVTRRIDLG